MEYIEQKVGEGQKSLLMLMNDRLKVASVTDNMPLRSVVQNITKEKIDRINELARLAKERELTPEELSERDALRKEYIAEWRRGAEQVLENTYIVTPDGKKRKLQKRG